MRCCRIIVWRKVHVTPRAHGDVIRAMIHISFATFSAITRFRRSLRFSPASVFYGGTKEEKEANYVQTSSRSRMKESMRVTRSRNVNSRESRHIGGARAEGATHFPKQGVDGGQSSKMASLSGVARACAHGIPKKPPAKRRDSLIFFLSLRQNSL